MTFMPGGRKPAGSGRKAGTPNKSTADVRAAAQLHGLEALKTLIHLMRNAEEDSVRRACANDILDRGFGKPRQQVEASGPDGGPIQTETITDAQRVAALMTILAKARQERIG